MFTGIIEEVGEVASMRHGTRFCTLTVNAQVVLADVHVGDSIAVNGVCLTVTSFTPSSFCADVMNETLARSSLARLRPGHAVNLERAMALGGRFGGHIVSGHIDGVGTITSVHEDGNAVWYAIEAAPEILALVVEKGSVAIDGISLTVARVTDVGFSVSVIPHTRAVTSLAEKRAGDVVNVENDVIGKYVQRLLDAGTQQAGAARSAAAQQAGAAEAGITWDFLLENGF